MVYSFFGLFQAVWVLYAHFRTALSSIFIDGVTRKNNRDEIVWVFAWEKFGLEISLKEMGRGRVVVEKQAVEGKHPKWWPIVSI